MLWSFYHSLSTVITSSISSFRRIYGKVIRVATTQGKQGILFLLFPDRKNTGNFVVIGVCPRGERYLWFQVLSMEDVPQTRSGQGYPLPSSDRTRTWIPLSIPRQDQDRVAPLPSGQDQGRGTPLPIPDRTIHSQDTALAVRLLRSHRIVLLSSSFTLLHP